MGANFSKVKTVVSGETILASDRNAEFDNILNNFDPDGMDDASIDATAMQAVVDPYPSQTISLPTNLRGELQRLRSVVKRMNGAAQWYISHNISAESHFHGLIF